MKNQLAQARNIAITNMNYSLNQLEAAGQLKAICTKDLQKFELESECQILDSYQCKLQYENQTITVFIKSLSNPHGAVLISIDNQDQAA